MDEKWFFIMIICVAFAAAIGASIDKYLDIEKLKVTQHCK